MTDRTWNKHVAENLRNLSAESVGRLSGGCCSIRIHYDGPVSNYAHQQITEDDILAVEAVLRSDRLTQGPMVERFEQALAEYVGARYAVAVSSGTTALHIVSLAALDHDAEVVTSPLSFVATANAFESAGNHVGFMDVDPPTGNMAYATLDCDAIVPVHFAGRACPMPAFSPVLPPIVIEDACHALGAMDFDGCSRVGSCAHSLATVFSFHPVKPITTGEGGAITTNDEGLAQELRSLRDHGREDGLMVRLGLNGRMSDIQAALGLSQLKRCGDMRQGRGAIAARYDDLLWRDNRLTVPPYFNTDAFHLYPVRIKNGRRDEVKAKLNARGIGVQVHYSPIIPLQPYYRERYGYKPGDFPNAEAWAAEELSLPLHAGMTAADVQIVVDALRGVLA